MFEKKVWNDRQSEHPARRRLTPTENDNEYEVSRAEGLVMEEGDAFDATTMNDLENRVAKAFAEYDPAELGAVNVTVQLYTCKKEGKVYSDAVLHTLELVVHRLVASQQIIFELGFVAPKAGQRQSRRNAHRAFGRQAALPDFFCNRCQCQQVVVVVYGLVPLDRLPPGATNKKAPVKL